MIHQFKRKRCLECKRRKKKCEVTGKKCTHCEKTGKKCQFQDIKELKRKKELTKKDLNRNKIDSKCNYSNIISTNGIENIFIPVRSINNTAGSPLLYEYTKLVNVWNHDAIVDGSISLSDFILSGKRVNFVKADAFDVKSCENVATATINHLITRVRSSARKDKQFLADRTSKVLASSLDDIDLEISIPNLKNILFIAEASVSSEIKDSNFINLPESISGRFSDFLFKHYCTVSYENQKFDDKKISALKVFLPLIFGNITVLKCILVLSFYDLLRINQNSPQLLRKKNEIHAIHVQILSELRERLNYYSSVCCDHSLLCVLLLSTIELVNGARGALWKKLQKLTFSMIALRGGVEKLSSNITGLCLLKLLTMMLSTGMSIQNLESNNGVSLSLKDFFYSINDNNDYEFFDNFNYRASLTLNQLKEVTKTYGHISTLQSLISVSLDANKKENALVPKNFIRYDTVSSENLVKVLQDAETLERRLRERNKEIDSNQLPFCHKLQFTFAFKVSTLYLYQLIYRQTSTSPKTILLVKLLLREAENVFNVFESIQEHELQNMSILILPLFCLGVDLITKDTREWYLDKLCHLLTRTKREMIRTSIQLLQLVWNLNRNGSFFVDWISLSDLNSTYLTLTC